MLQDAEVEQKCITEKLGEYSSNVKHIYFYAFLSSADSVKNSTLVVVIKM